MREGRYVQEIRERGGKERRRERQVGGRGDALLFRSCLPRSYSERCGAVRN